MTTVSGRPRASGTARRRRRPAPRRGPGILRLWLGAGIGVVPPAAAGLSRPALCLTLAAAELTVVLLAVLVFGLIMTVAILRGSDVTSERAFRLLRFLSGRPEPGPPPAGPGRAARRRASTR